MCLSASRSSRKTIPFHEFLCKVASTLNIRSRVGTVKAARDVVRTVRLCCDAMAEIILELLPTRHTMLRSKELLMPVYEVADAMILGHKNAQIYKIVMAAFEQLSGASPPPPPTADMPDHRRLPTLRSVDVRDKMLAAIALLKEIPAEVTAVRKVQVLVRALSALASADTLADELLQVSLSAVGQPRFTSKLLITLNCAAILRHATLSGHVNDQLEGGAAVYGRVHGA